VEPLEVLEARSELPVAVAVELAAPERCSVPGLERCFGLDPFLNYRQTFKAPHF
jgi:hypothetical protein